MSLPLADAVRGMIHVLGDAEWEADARKIADNIAKLERENAALRRDSDRLNWLITKGPVEVLVTLSSDPVVARKNIDKEMEFPTV